MTENKVFVDEAFRFMVNGAIPATGRRRKTLARLCGISPPRFSEMLSGDRPFPDNVRQVLTAELHLEKAWAKLSAPAGWINEK